MAKPAYEEKKGFFSWYLGPERASCSRNGFCRNVQKTKTKSFVLYCLAKVATERLFEVAHYLAG